MKIVAYLGFVLVAMLFISCNPDDNAVTASIFGEWQLTHIVFGVGSFEEPLSECQRTQIYNYTENGNIQRYYVASSNCTKNAGIITYILDGNTLTTHIELDGNIGSYTESNIIETLNATTLKFIEMSNSGDGDLPPESRATYTYARVN